ncbi:MAG: ATP synthase F0 subunit B [Proteobacteria bacterium]|nr:ATP synthase F0 subunit B [Pseudomonadota bacterium]MBU4258192.1 ATP synthase F0 subunit B [Pseudomonadota bacterium]MBU4287451.1 ATP synthase F0 subunit B [Pseudomonadota bacterium]
MKRNSIMMFIITALLFFFVGVALGASGGESGPKGWVATDTYRVMNFAVLVGALFFILRKPVAQFFSSRIKGIENQLSELETKKKDAEQKLEEYTEKLAQLDKEAKKIVDDYIRQGNEAKARILQEAESVADKLKEQALRNIDYEINQAKLRLQGEILEKAIMKAEEIIRDEITIEDHDRLVDEYLEKVVA